jgi:hypothetical protein
MQHRLTVVTTHPAQYYAPWFRCISRNCPEIELTAVHAIQPTVEQQGVGFGQAFEWDLPLTEGYRCHTARQRAICSLLTPSSCAMATCCLMPR